MEEKQVRIPNEDLHTMEGLADAEFVRLMRWCLAYSVTGEEDRVELTGNERLFRNTCVVDLGRASAGCRKRCRTRGEDGSRERL